MHLAIAMKGADVLRDATDADLDLIRTWRNHPRVRQASLSTAEVSYDEHLRWWERISSDIHRYVLIFERDGHPCGVVNFAQASPSGHSEWGFFLDIEGLSGSGDLLAAWMELERSAVAYGFEQLGLASMGGWTLAWNTQVLTLHRRFGFVEDPARRKAVEIDGTPQEVVWTELTADRYRTPPRAYPSTT